MKIPYKLSEDTFDNKEVNAVKKGTKDPKLAASNIERIIVKKHIR